MLVTADGYVWRLTKQARIKMKADIKAEKFTTLDDYGKLLGRVETLDDMFDEEADEKGWKKAG